MPSPLLLVLDRVHVELLHVVEVACHLRFGIPPPGGKNDGELHKLLSVKLLNLIYSLMAKAINDILPTLICTEMRLPGPRQSSTPPQPPRGLRQTQCCLGSPPNQ